jgi:hypothetical protein
MATSTHTVHVGDTLHPAKVQLTRPDGSVVDLTGLTVKFYAVDEAGASSIALTDATVTDADQGYVEYDLQPADVATPTTHYGYWRVIDPAQDDEYETFPVASREYEIVVVAD